MMPQSLNWIECADNVELGTACGKLHRVSVLAITDPGAAYVHQFLYFTEHQLNASGKQVLSGAQCSLQVIRILSSPPVDRSRHLPSRAVKKHSLIKKLSSPSTTSFSLAFTRSLALYKSDSLPKYVLTSIQSRHYLEAKLVMAAESPAQQPTPVRPAA